MASVSVSARARGPQSRIRIGEASAILGIHPNSLRRWVSENQISCYRYGKGGNRFFEMADILAFSGEELTSGAGKVVCWSRCSTQTKAQIQNLQRQKIRVRQFAESHYPQDEIVELSTNSSGFNLRNPLLTQLIRMVCNREVKVLICEWFDRIGRSLTPIILLLCEIHGVKVIAIEEDENKTDTQQLMEDICSLITLYQSRKMGSRGGKRKELSPETIEAAHSLIASGKNWSECQREIERRGLRNQDGSVISAKQIRGAVELSTIKIEHKGESSVDEFLLTSTQRPENYRTSTAHAYEGYQKFCKELGLPISSRPQFFSKIKNQRTSTRLNGRVSSYFKGIVFASVPHTVVKSYTGKIEDECATESFLRYLQSQKGWKGKIEEFHRNYQNWTIKEKVAKLNKIRVNLTLNTLGIQPKRLIQL